jgi:hypothetical protein
MDARMIDANIFELHYAQERAIANAWRAFYKAPIIKQSDFVAAVLARCPQANPEYVASELARRVRRSRYRGNNRPV